MRIFRHWVEAPFTTEIDGEKFSGKCFGGSNASEAEALADARSRWNAVCERICGRADRDSISYAADIREEIVRTLNAGNIVTRNRYGAEVLNSTDHLFVDIDSAPPSWLDLFKRPKTAEQRRDRIIAHVRRMAGHRSLAAAGIRIYATPRGIRLLITGLNHAPGSPDTRQVMNMLNADRLYMHLCGRQACYRARLTPKPVRIKVKTPRCTWPRKPGDDARIRDWVEVYNAAASKYAACRLVDTIGSFVSTEVTEFHDRRCHALEDLPMA